MTSFAKPLAYSVLTLCVICATVSAQAQRQQNYIGDGGKAISLTIYVPQSTGLAKDQSYIPALVQGEFVSNFSNFSAISILDWERLDDIYVKLVNEAYDDKAAAKQDVVLGRLAPTSHFLTGNITKTATGYNVKMNITKTADKMTVATYSGTFTFAELDNLTGIRRASLELLQKVGVELTESARQELAGAAAANQISAQTALAKGVTAQRAGTEVAALSYFYQAASFNPALKEAVKRSSITAANIKSGNIGADLRNDILWRKNWVARLKETEETFYEMINAADPPFSLTYFTDIKMGDVNYQTETANLNIIAYVDVNKEWFIALERSLGAVQAVLDGLNATNRKDDWGLGGLYGWPSKGVSDTNPFERLKEYKFKVAFELINQLGRVIGNQTIEFRSGFSMDVGKDSVPSIFVYPIISGGLRPYNSEFINVAKERFITVDFYEVSANDISDNLTIRVAAVNDAPPQKARFAITAVPKVETSPPFTDARNGKTYNTVTIGGKTWMAENLNYQPQTGKSWCYDNDNNNCNKYGRLYDWNTAMTACPEGWHLSTKEEWDYLVNLINAISGIGSNDAGKMLKSKNGWNLNNNNNEGGNGTDAYGFSALPGGANLPGGTACHYRGYCDKTGFGGIGTYSYWWTASKQHNRVAYYWYIINDYIREEGEGEYNVSGYSVRCIKGGRMINDYNSGSESASAMNMHGGEMSSSQTTSNSMNATDTARTKPASRDQDLALIIDKYEKLLDGCKLKKTDRCADVIYTLGAFYADQANDEQLVSPKRTGPDYSKSLNMYRWLIKEYPNFPKLPDVRKRMTQMELQAGSAK